MAKIFVSYKYKDTNVNSLDIFSGSTTVRDYVNELEKKLIDNNDIYKGEEDDDDLSDLSEERIAKLLYDRIYDSSITIVLISKGMKENKLEKDQWIPREVSYSLSEHSRGGRTSHTNAVLAVVIPDENGSYEYFVEEHNCVNNCRSWKIEDSASPVFEIIRNNMFNREKPETKPCADHGLVHQGTDHSFIHPVKWIQFIADINGYIRIATDAQDNIDDYKLEKISTV